jgi:Zn-dependent M28 family amino/carboxypeptidase
MRASKLWLIIAVPAMAVAVALGVQQRESGPAVGASPFDAARAFQDLETVVGFGPRPAGSSNLRMTRDYIVSQLREAGLDPRLDEFVASTPAGPIEMANVLATVAGRGAGTVAVAGHYDTKRFDFPFLGANDGGSSTALLLELARILPGLDLEHSIEIIFFDGEEAVRDWSAADSLYGSRHDVDRRYDAGTLGDLRALILVDMIGDRDLEILQEARSTDWLRDLIWETAETLGYGEHFGRSRQTIEDDHVPYLNAGIPAVDLIDFDYDFWHTAQDTLDKTDAASLKVVGDVLYNVLPALDARLAEAR